MPKKCIKFISEFLIPNLNEERFGDRLKWLDREKEIFQIDWYHKGGPRWTEREAEVFVEWDKHKGHYHPEGKMYFTQSKQRFRALLYKLTCDGKIIQHNSTNKFIKIYSIAEKKMKRRKRSSLSSTSDSSEYEMLEQPMISQMCDIDLEDENRRSVSDDSTKHILEDHSYTSVGYESGTEKDHVTFHPYPDFITIAQELTDSSSENVKMKWNYSFNNLNNSPVSIQDSSTNPTEKVIVKVKYPNNECYNYLASLELPKCPEEKVIVKWNSPHEQNLCFQDNSLQASKVLAKLNNPYNELNRDLTLSNGDLFSVPKATLLEDTYSPHNIILKIQDDLNSNTPKTMHINLWKITKENEVPLNVSACNYNGLQDMGLIFESTPLLTPETDLDDLLFM